MQASEFYTGIVAEVYGVLRGTHFDAGRYRSFIQEHGTPALELGCGDEGPFYDLVAEGVDLDGVDSSVDMVRRGRERLLAQGSNAVVHHQPMEQLALDRTYASIYLAGPTFNLLPDDNTGLLALRAIAAHLQPDGATLVPLWTPPPTPAEEIGAVHRAPIDHGEARYFILGEEYDVAARTRTTRMRYELATQAGTSAQEREWIIHWHTSDGFRDLAAQAGLEAQIAGEGNLLEATLVARSNSSGPQR